jgi:aspartokinase/homoserine dehydrogenase 1
MKTGDRLLRFSGILSDSLSIISRLLEDSVSFSAPIFQAKARGFMKPNHRDGLLSSDAVRKFLSLTRKARLPVKSKDVQVSPILLFDFASVWPVDECMSKIPQIDGYFKKLIENIRKEETVLSYLRETERGKCKVGVIAMSKNDLSIRSGMAKISWHFRVRGPGQDRSSFMARVARQRIGICV